MTRPEIANGLKALLSYAKREWLDIISAAFIIGITCLAGEWFALIFAVGFVVFLLIAQEGHRQYVLLLTSYKELSARNQDLYILLHDVAKSLERGDAKTAIKAYNFHLSSMQQMQAESKA